MRCSRLTSINQSMRLTVDSIRNALREIDVLEAEGMNDEELKKADFLQDLEMDERSVCSMMSQLERKLHIMLPPSIMSSLKAKNTVAVFITTANHHLIDLLEGR